MKSAELSISASSDKAHESYKDRIESFFKTKISEIKSKISERFGFKGDKLTEATDEALVYEATETIKTADEDGMRTEAEKADIGKAVASVLIEGAMEEAGMEKSAGENPILMLGKEVDPGEITASLIDLDAENVTLEDGSPVAELAVEAIERAYENIDQITVETAEMNELMPKAKLADTIRAVNSSEIIRSGETIYRPKQEIRCDHDHIEGQRLDVINKGDKGVTEVCFKLRKGVEFNPRHVTRDGILISKDIIEFSSIDGHSEQMICSARSYERDGVKVFLANPSDEDEVRAMNGFVKIEASSDMAPEDIEKTVQKIIEGDLGIPDGLGEVSEASERNYKMSRYAWQHKIEGPLTPEQQKAAEKLEREEVFSGYTTLVEKGKHKEYLEQYGDDLRAIHNLYSGSTRSIFRMLTVGGMCSTERYKRGLIKSGLSTLQDFKTGGSDSFFTRVSNERERKHLDGVNVVFKPELFDRTDWYTYDKDEYGTTDEETFADRNTPEEIFESASHKSWIDNNEQMFRTGIGPQYIESIIVPAEDRDSFIKELKEMGLKEFDGKPIEEIIISYKDEDASAKTKANAIFDKFMWSK